MNPHRSPRAAALGLLACVALAAPAAADSPSAYYQQSPTAKIGDTPADYPGASRAPATPAPAVGDTPADYPGMPGASAAGGLADPAPTPTGEPGGFDWPSAAIGAAGVGLLIVLSLGAASAASACTPARSRGRAARRATRLG